MKIKRLLALCCVTFLVIIGFAPAASASSQYDSYIVTTAELQVRSNQTWYPCDSTTYQHDWSTEWKRLILDDQFWSFGGQLQYHNEYSQAFKDSLNTGGWAVTDIYNDGTDADKGVVIRIIYSPSGLTSSWGANGGVFISQDGSILYQVDVQVFQNGGCQPKVWTASRPADAWFGYSNNTTVRAFSVGERVSMQYPSSYEGQFITTEPAPVLYSGTIDCGGVDALAMIIEQPYNDGSAILSPGSYGLTNWSYSLTSAPYRAGINCGGKWIYTPYVDPVTIDRDWVCDAITRYPYCS